MRPTVTPSAKKKKTQKVFIQISKGERGLGLNESLNSVSFKSAWDKWEFTGFRFRGLTSGMAWCRLPSTARRMCISPSLCSAFLFSGSQEGKMTTGSSRLTSSGSATQAKKRSNIPNRTTKVPRLLSWHWFESCLLLGIVTEARTRTYVCPGAGKEDGLSPQCGRNYTGCQCVCQGRGLP